MEKTGKEEKCIDAEIPFEIPDSWAWARLGEISNFGQCRQTDVAIIDDDVWMLDLADIEKDTGVLKSRKNLSDIKPVSQKHQFFKGNILYSKLRPYLNKVIIADMPGY